MGKFAIANAFGLYEMHGNIGEWCLDHWHVNYEGAPTDGSAWLSSDGGKKRVIRSCFWSAASRNCRSAYRIWYVPDPRKHYFGFRVVGSL